MFTRRHPEADNHSWVARHSRESTGLGSQKIEVEGSPLLLPNMWLTPGLSTTAAQQKHLPNFRHTHLDT